MATKIAYIVCTVFDALLKALGSKGVQELTLQVVDRGTSNKQGYLWGLLLDTSGNPIPAPMNPDAKHFMQKLWVPKRCVARDDQELNALELAINEYLDGLVDLTTDDLENGVMAKIRPGTIVNVKCINNAVSLYIGDGKHYVVSVPTIVAYDVIGWKALPEKAEPSTPASPTTVRRAAPTLRRQTPKQKS